jgi:hypothetical protein
MAKQENWKKETAKAAVPVVLLWASTAVILWVLLTAKNEEQPPESEQGE